MIKRSLRIGFGFTAVVTAILTFGAVAPANAIVYPVRVVNSNSWTFSDGWQTYSCTTTALMTVYSSSVTGKSTLTCSKAHTNLVVYGVLGNSPLVTNTKACQLTSTCSVSMSKPNLSGIQTHCYIAPDVSINGIYAVPGSASRKICFND
jgi:hypothetical protein